MPGIAFAMRPILSDRNLISSLSWPDPRERIGRARRKARVGERIDLKHLGKMPQHCGLGLRAGYRATEEPRQRRDAALADAAGNNVAEVAQVGVDVQGEAVAGDPVGD